MNKIRIGKDITINWQVTISSGISLEDADLTLIMVNPKLEKTELDFTVDGDVITATVLGTEQKCCGVHKLTLWLNYGQEGQSALDKTDAFRLVMFTDEEEFEDEPFSEAVVDLDGRIYTVDQGIKIVNVSGDSIIVEGTNTYNNF